MHPPLLPPRRRSVLTVLAVGLVVAALPGVAAAAGSTPAPAKILSVAWGSSNQTACPGGTATNLDNIPVVFTWFIRPASIRPSDFTVVREDGTTVQATCAIQYPPDERNELQTINMIGDFGEPIAGQRPVELRVTGALQGRPIGSVGWRAVGRLAPHAITQLEAAPFIVDAWTLTPRLYAGDRNRCTVGSTFVRVVWSNGITAYSTGAEVGSAVTASYRAVYTRDGRRLSVAPLAIADLNDHSTAAMADNMHDLCLPAVPRTARLRGITLAADLVQDPNGDPNAAQRFSVRG
jgi:hypothetical protein